MSLTISALIDNKQERRGAKFEEYNDLTDELKKLRAVAEPTAEQFARVDAIKVRKTEITAETARMDAEIAELRSELESDEAIARLQGKVEPGAARATAVNDDERVRVGAEPRTYSRESSAAEGRSFFRDAWLAETGKNTHARERLERHAREVEVHKEMSSRAVTSGVFGGLIVPQYLVEYAAIKLRAGRPTANIVARHELPASGMNLVIPRGTVGATADVQNGENTAVSNTDEAWADLTVPVRTISGQQDVSRQSLERGDGVDELVYLDLTRAYAASIGTQVINGTGAAGQMLGILNTGGIASATAFGAAVSAANLNKKIAGANAAVWSGGQGLAPDVLVMHPRRWGWLTGESDTNGRPIVQANAQVAYNSVAVGGFGGENLADSATPFVGVHSSGIPVLLDANIPVNVGTNVEDVILSLDSDELHLWEEGDGMPRQLSFEQTAGGSLTTKLVVYGYAAFTAGRYPAAVAKVGGADTVGGNGLLTPTF